MINGLLAATRKQDPISDVYFQSFRPAGSNFRTQPSDPRFEVQLAQWNGERVRSLEFLAPVGVVLAVQAPRCPGDEGLADKRLLGQGPAAPSESSARWSIAATALRDEVRPSHALMKKER